MASDRTFGLLLQNNAGVKWAFAEGLGGYACGSIYVNDVPVEAPLESGFLLVRNRATGRQRWLCATSYERVDQTTGRFSGETRIDAATLSFQAIVSLPQDLLVAEIEYRFSVNQDLSGWEVCFAYHADFAHSWSGHVYPLAEDAKAIAEHPLTYVGVPSVLLYRSDFSLALLYGFDLQFDYLNPTTWTGDCGFFFTDGVVPPQFRVGKNGLKAGIEYVLPLQLIFSSAGDVLKAIPSLVQQWIALNQFAVEPLHVRNADEAFRLFVEGRRNTSLWNPGIGYQLEEGDPEAHFVYMGEQPLSAYFEYLLYEMTGDPLWRQRCFAQMDFVLKAQDTDPASVNYGVFHTAFDLGKRVFDSDDRGSNVGYKPDLNAYMARYMLMTWQRVKDHEGLDRQEWYQAAVRAAYWVLRQRNADGGLPQVVRYPFVYMKHPDDDTDKHFHKSISSAPGRALPAMPIIYEITGDERFHEFAESLESFVRRDVEGHCRFTGHHPDLPPDELEEASIWGIIEYWLDKYDRTGSRECLARAVADAYLSLLWWCPKQLSWVKNPTQCASAEQQHYLQYSIYCYQNRKVQCLWRLHEHTGELLLRQLCERVLQGIFWTQISEGNLRGATHERIADPWLARDDNGEPEFNSLGTIYMGEQSLDCMFQLLEMGKIRREFFE